MDPTDKSGGKWRGFGAFFSLHG